MSPKFFTFLPLGLHSLSIVHVHWTACQGEVPVERGVVVVAAKEGGWEKMALQLTKLGKAPF